MTADSDEFIMGMNLCLILRDSAGCPAAPSPGADLHSEELAHAEHSAVRSSWSQSQSIGRFAWFSDIDGNTVGLLQPKA
jgi:hypothetical protein